MVNSERDQSFRIYNYLRRLQDGGPLLIPAGAQLPLRHIYGADAVRAILAVLAHGPGTGQAYNITQDETVTLPQFLNILADCVGRPLSLCQVDRPVLVQHDLLPACSPFSNRWMSILGNRRSKEELGMQYTPLADYLERLIAHYREHPVAEPKGYERRREELGLAATLGWS